MISVVAMVTVRDLYGSNEFMVCRYVASVMVSVLLREIYDAVCVLVEREGGRERGRMGRGRGRGRGIGKQEG